MRVIAGRLGGRRLLAPVGRRTRPTSERVREALFSMLGPMDGLRVLDLFAGSGALGIEALSRGATHAVFVERAAGALSALRANLAALDLRGELAIVRRAEAVGVLRTARERGETYDLVFLDPPYRNAARLARQLSDPLPGVLAPGARVIVESDRRGPLELDLPLADERRYGDTLIRIHQADPVPDPHTAAP
jgi:16S rRNA (guanine(966)-N(2))-methyltransferase RsmD